MHVAAGYAVASELLLVSAFKVRKGGLRGRLQYCEWSYWVGMSFQNS